MKDQFVTYEIANRLKELGFNEECLAIYASFYSTKSVDLYFDYLDEFWNYDIVLPAPLWQQAIDWINKKYDRIIPYDSDKTFLAARFLHVLNDIKP